MNNAIIKEDLEANELDYKGAISLIITVPCIAMMWLILFLVNKVLDIVPTLRAKETKARENQVTNGEYVHSV